jgi:DNA-binding response OmpR family regulator
VVDNASDFKEYALQRDIKFTIKCDVNLNKDVYFDHNVIEKIIMNLLNNAFKYSNNGTSIEIESIADYSTFQSNYVNKFTVNENTHEVPMFGIVVRDKGIGISEKSIQHVFDRFYMVNDPKGESHLGSGVGLALVKSLVLVHKGSIEICSERDKGTDIIVAFPYLKSEYDFLEFSENVTLGFPSSESKLQMLDDVVDIDKNVKDELDNIYLSEKRSILLAEDNDELRSLIAESLASHYQVFEAANGVVATQLLESKDFDLILSDIMMPEKDGVTFCREVKENISSCHIPFILMTAKGGVENKIEGIGSGADAYLEKPVNLKLLQLTILNLLKQQIRIKDFYAKNFYSESGEIKGNQLDNEFMKKLVELIESKLDQVNLDNTYLATEMAMSRSKLYIKVKGLTGKSLVEFVRYYRLRKAVKLLVEDNMSIQDVMQLVGFESQSYFTTAFKKEFGENPRAYVANAKQKK